MSKPKEWVCGDRIKKYKTDNDTCINMYVRHLEPMPRHSPE